MAAERFIPLDDRQDWAAALAGIRHGFAHTWDSAHALSLTTGYPTFLYDVSAANGTRVVCPLVERSANGHRDVATPYGFSGFVGTGPWSGFPEVWAESMHRHGYVSAYVGLNPLFADDSHVRAENVWPTKQVYVLDLAEGIDGLYRNLSTNRRRQLRGWRPGEHDDDRARLTRFFVRTYPDFMQRKVAAAYYRFSADTLSALCEPSNVFLLGAGSRGEVEAVSVFSHTPYVGEFLFNASIDGGEHHSVPLLWSAVHRLTELRVPLLNLGGGLRPGDTLAQFKERFGGQRRPLRALKEVYDPGTYAALCRQRGRDPATRDGFFPAYRDP